MTDESELQDQTCDEPGCQNTDVDWVGSIYYACEDHKEVFEEVVE